MIPLRIALAALAVAGMALALLSLAEHRGLARERREAARWLAESGVPAPPGLAAEPDPVRVRLRAARAALAFEMDPARTADLAALPEAEAARERQAGAARMAGAARRAAAVLADRPAAWDAHMILGAATYLGWLQGRDTHLFTAAARWEEPLAAALRLAPARREPARFLASAYLDVWPALSPAKRETARALLAETFRNPDDLRLLIDRWYEVAHAAHPGDLARGHAELFSLIPPDPGAWDQVLSALSWRRGQPQWETAWSAAWQRWDAALLAQLRRDAAFAGERLAAGDRRAARERFLTVLTRARPDTRYREVLAIALEKLPPGPVDRATARRLVPLLTWALDRCLYSECALEPEALRRLARLAGPAAPAAEALAAVVTGDLPRAQLLERRAGVVWTEEWAPFLAVKARVLAGRGQAVEAREALAQIPRSWQRHPLYWQARVELERAGEETVGTRAAADALAGLRATAWPGTAWEWDGETARLAMLAGRPADRLVVELDEAPPAGAVVEVKVDGRSLGALSAPPAAPGGGGGPRALRLDWRTAGGGLHLLEVRSLEGGRVVPGAVRLL